MSVETLLAKLTAVGIAATVLMLPLAFFSRSTRLWKLAVFAVGIAALASVSVLICDMTLHHYR